MDRRGCVVPLGGRPGTRTCGRYECPHRRRRPRGSGSRARDDLSAACVLCDHDPPATDALDAFRTFRSAVGDCPFVVVTGRGSESFAGEAFAAGVSGYVPKDGGREVTGTLAEQVDALLRRNRANPTTVRADSRGEKRSSDRRSTPSTTCFTCSTPTDDSSGGTTDWGRCSDSPTANSGGVTPPEFFVPDDRDAIEAAVSKTLESGQTVVEARARIADGTVVGLCGIGRDVTDRRNRERKLAGQNERLDEFASVVSHDLRNPLSVARGYLELAASTGDPDSLETVVSALDRADRIIDDVLTAAREGRAVDATEAVPLAGVVRAAWNGVHTADATLSVTTDAVVEADPDRLQRLFENLFRNSVEHGSTRDRADLGDSVEHGSTGDRSDGDDGVDRSNDGLTVTVSDAVDGFVVADDGWGFSADALEHTFEAGYITSAEGTGLGLMIVRNLAEAHGWTVDAERAPDGGACFRFSGVRVSGSDEPPVDP